MRLFGSPKNTPAAVNIDIRGAGAEAMKQTLSGQMGVCFADTGSAVFQALTRIIVFLTRDRPEQIYTKGGRPGRLWAAPGPLKNHCTPFR